MYKFYLLGENCLFYQDRGKSHIPAVSQTVGISGCKNIGFSDWKGCNISQVMELQPSNGSFMIIKNNFLELKSIGYTCVQVSIKVQIHFIETMRK